jgi:putative inorganic carbon (HCO3(-)) transporter
VKVLVLVGFVAGLIGIIQVVLGVETPGNWVEEGESTRTRAFSIVTSPNVLGSYMAFISPVAIGLFLSSRHTKERILWAIVTLTGVLALLFTFSRGAWFAFAFVLFIGSFYWKPRIARWVLLAGIVGFVALFFVPEGIPVLSTVSDRLTTLFSAQYLEKSLEGGRLGRWIEAYHKMRLEPLFGVGPGHHGGAVASRHFGTIYSDSYFFKSLAELGIIGVTLLISLVVITLRYAAGVVRAFVNTPHFFTVLGLFCGLLAVSLHNLVENIFEVPFMSLYFWLFGGFVSKLYADQSQLKRW